MGVLLLRNRNKSIFCKSVFDALEALHAIVAGVQLDNHLINALQIFWWQKLIFGTFDVAKNSCWIFFFYDCRQTNCRNVNFPEMLGIFRDVK